MAESKVSPSSSPDDPFLYCEECLKVAHHGRKQCYHQEEPISEHSKIIAEVKMSVSDLQRIIERSFKASEVEKVVAENSAVSVSSAKDKLRELFGEVRALVDAKEKEVMAQCDSINANKLQQFGRKQVILQQERTTAQKVAQNATENVEDILKSTKPHLLCEATAKIKKQLEDKGIALERLQTRSPYPKFTNLLGVIPAGLYMKDAVKKYSFSDKLEWDEGDLVNEVFVYSTKPLIVQSNYFWVWEYISDDTNTALFHLSESLKALMSEQKEPLQDISPESLVCAYYEVESSWHRGLAERIFEKKGKTLVSVRFLDYGNVEDVPIEWVAELPPDFAEYPFQCRLCHFSDHVTFNDREVRWTFMDCVKGRKMIAKIIKRTYLSGSVIPIFSIELYDDQNTNIGLTLWRLIQEKSSKNQEGFPIKYHDIRYKGGVSGVVSPQPSNRLGRSPSTEDVVPKTSSDMELTLTNSEHSLKGSDKKTPEPVEVEPGISPNQELEPSGEITVELNQETVSAPQEADNKATPIQEIEDQVKNVVLEDETKKVEDVDVGIESGLKEGERLDEPQNCTSTENRDVPNIAERLATPTELSQTDNALPKPDEALLIEDTSPLSNRAHTSPSSLSSPGPSSSPSQVISQSQSDSYQSHTPCQGDESFYSDETESEPPPPVCTTEEEERDSSTKSPPPVLSMKEEDGYAAGQVKVPGILTLDLDTPGDGERSAEEGSETKEKSLDVPKDYVPPLHPIIFEGADLSLLVNSSLFEDGSFWAQLILKEEEQALYDKLSDDLQSYSYEKGQYTPVFFGPADFCMALFSEDELWYRGIIEEGGERKSLLVRFLDFGNSELVDLPDIMALKTRFRQLPFQSVKCSLASEDKTVFTGEECERFNDCFSNDNLITATVVSVSDGTAFVEARVCETDDDLLGKVINRSQVKSRSYSFEMPPYEETQLDTWADRMEEDGVFTSDTELVKVRQRMKKSELDIKEPLSGGETTTAKRESVKKMARKSTQPSDSGPLVSTMRSSQICHGSSSSSVSSHSSHTRCSVDTTGVTRFLKLPDKEVEKSPSADNGINKGANGGLSSSRRSPDRRDDRCFDLDSKKERGGSGRKKGRGEGRGVLMTRWDSDKEVRPGESCPSPSSFPSYQSPSFSRKKQPRRRRVLEPNMITVLVFGLYKYSRSEVYTLFNKYGSVADVRMNTRGKDSFYIDIEKTGASKAKDSLHGTKISDACRRTVEVVILDN